MFQELNSVEGQLMHGQFEDAQVVGSFANQAGDFVVNPEVLSAEAVNPEVLTHSSVSGEDSQDFIPELEPILVVKNEFKKTGYSSDELRQRNLILVTNIRDNYLELAQCLFESYVDEKWRSWGFASFKEYAQKELGIRYGKASYLKNIWLHFGKDEQLLRQMESVGWDKLKELTRVVTPENSAEWVGKANLLSADDLKKEVKTYLKSMVPDSAAGALGKESEVRGTPLESNLHPLTLQLTYDDKLALMTAAEKVQAQTGASLSAALGLICADYLGSSENQAIEQVLSAVKRYESLTSLRFVVLDQSGQSLLHGQDLLNDIVRKAIEGRANYCIEG
jgi:hypothetical protein